MVRLLSLRQDGVERCSFSMTIKGIARTCMGELFDDQSEVERLSHAFHSCWKEMEVWQLLVE